jgi:hypothetical protein
VADTSGQIGGPGITRSAVEIRDVVTSAKPRLKVIGLKRTRNTFRDGMRTRKHGGKLIPTISGNGGNAGVMECEIQDGIAPERLLKSTRCRRWRVRYKTRWIFRPFASILV